MTAFQRVPGPKAYHPRLGMCRDWMIFFVFGYIQWFVVLPRLWRYAYGLWR